MFKRFDYDGIKDEKKTATTPPKPAESGISAWFSSSMDNINRMFSSSSASTVAPAPTETQKSTSPGTRSGGYGAC